MKRWTTYTTRGIHWWIERICVFINDRNVFWHKYSRFHQLSEINASSTNIKYLPTHFSQSNRESFIFKTALPFTKPNCA